MDIFDQSKFCNLIPPTENGGGTSSYNPDYSINPNIISGEGFGDPYFASDPNKYSEPIFHYPNGDTKYYSPIEIRDLEEYKVLYTPPTDMLPTYTPPTDTPIKEGNNKITQKTEFELMEYIKKPEVMGVGALIAIILILKFI